MRNKKYPLVIFDMDGTVLDSDPMIVASMNALYDKYRGGRRTPIEEIYYFSGPPIKETLKKEFPDLDINFIFDEFHKESYSRYKSHTKAYPYSKEVLLKLKKEGFILAVVTNKLHSLTEYALSCIGLDNIFTYIIGSDDVRFTKPHEEGMLKVINHFHETKNHAIYIGDNTSDYLTSVNAGIDCCLVNWGPRKLPENISPKYKINSYLELEDILYE